MTGKFESFGDFCGRKRILEPSTKVEFFKEQVFYEYFALETQNSPKNVFFFRNLRHILLIFARKLW
jgi:hypothetical protein